MALTPIEPERLGGPALLPPPPPGPGVMRQRWARLLFLHWEVDAATLAGKLPPGLTLDEFRGRAFVGLVPFTMTGIRAAWLPPIRGLSRFHEVNVRTYVRGPDGTPGVWFFSLDAANAVAVKVARWTYKLPYFFARMAMHPPEGTDNRGPIHYESTRRSPGPDPPGCRLKYEPAGLPSSAVSGTLAHFLVERYVLFAQARGRLFSGRVHHSPYPLQSARLLDWEETLIEAAGITRSSEAPLAHYAREVRVKIFGLRPILPAR